MMQIRHCLTIAMMLLPALSYAMPQVCAPNICLDVDIAVTALEQKRGLQGREGLNPNQGMLFVFAQDDRSPFWMKDMKFPLDIIWMDAQGHIVFIGDHLPPCIKDPCAVYTPKTQARYVLEVQAGFADAQKWHVGDALKIKGVLGQ